MFLNPLIHMLLYGVQIQILIQMTATCKFLPQLTLMVNLRLLVQPVKRLVRLLSTYQNTIVTIIFQSS